eukprot:356133-Chlamydomonas_euryale.AAC.23
MPLHAISSATKEYCAAMRGGCSCTHMRMADGRAAAHRPWISRPRASACPAARAGSHSDDGGVGTGGSPGSDEFSTWLAANPLPTARGAAPPRRMSGRRRMVLDVHSREGSPVGVDEAAGASSGAVGGPHSGRYATGAMGGVPRSRGSSRVGGHCVNGHWAVDGVANGVANAVDGTSCTERTNGAIAAMAAAAAVPSAAAAAAAEAETAEAAAAATAGPSAGAQPTQLRYAGTPGRSGLLQRAACDAGARVGSASGRSAARREQTAAAPSAHGGSTRAFHVAELADVFCALGRHSECVCLPVHARLAAWSAVMVFPGCLVARNGTGA